MHPNGRQLGTPIYVGLITQNIAEFFTNLEDLCDVDSLNNDEERIRCLKRNLGGEPRIYLETLIRAGNLTYKVAKEALRKQFVSEAKQRSARKQLASCVMKVDEKVRDFATRYRNLRRDADVPLDSEGTAADFVMRLIPAIEVHLNSQRFETFQDAVASAEGVELSLSSTSEREELKKLIEEMKKLRAPKVMRIEDRSLRKDYRSADTRRYESSSDYNRRDDSRGRSRYDDYGSYSRSHDYTRSRSSSDERYPCRECSRERSPDRRDGRYRPS